MGRQLSGPLNPREERLENLEQINTLVAGQLPLAIPTLGPIVELVWLPALTGPQKPLQPESF